MSNTTTQQQKYSKLFRSFAQRKANNSKHGRSQSQIFTETNMLITLPVWYVVKCSYGDLTSCPYLVWWYPWWLQPVITIKWMANSFYSITVAAQCGCSAALFKTATQYNMIWFSITKMFCSSITGSLSRQVPRLHQCSYGLAKNL